MDDTNVSEMNYGFISTLYNMNKTNLNAIQWVEARNKYSILHVFAHYCQRPTSGSSSSSSSQIAPRKTKMYINRYLLASPYERYYSHIHTRTYGQKLPSPLDRCHAGVGMNQLFNKMREVLPQGRNPRDQAYLKTFLWIFRKQNHGREANSRYYTLLPGWRPGKSVGIRRHINHV